MKCVTVRAVITCGHQGVVGNLPSQTWVRIGGAPVLVDSDPEGRGIAGCPNYGPTIKPCTKTLRVISGYSSWLSIGGRGAVMSNLDGPTHRTPPGTGDHTVRHPRQTLLEGDP